MTKTIFNCIDAGSEYCPCYLAETNDCIVCSHLQGKDFCDCNWNGVCIYNEFYWCSNKKKDERKINIAQIIDKKEVSSDIILFKIKVTKTLARQLKHPGSYIFIRDPKKPNFFDVPMSIMYADDYKGEIHIAVQMIGIKTKSLLQSCSEILIKGPYWNGILGLKFLKGMIDEQILVIARGMSLAPSIPVIKYLLKNKNHITLVMDPGKIETIFIKDYIKDLNIKKIEVNLKTNEGLNTVRNLLKLNNFSLVYSAGSDNLHHLIANEIHQTSKDMKHVITNNSLICCGEGVCGGCIRKINSGETVKMCKTQLQAKDILKEGNLNV